MKSLISKQLYCQGETVYYVILKYVVICKYAKNNAGWIRIFGIGIKWKHEKIGLIFSERIGKRKYIKIGSWVFGYLPYIKQEIHESRNKIT